MIHPNHPLELLAPARNADFGIEAIKHGADAVYIGGPAFGARYGASIDVAARTARASGGPPPMTHHQSPTSPG